MIRFGVTVTFLGFISAILHYTDVQFRILMWSEPMQPTLGLVVGGVGVLVIVGMLALSKNDTQQAQPAGAPAPQQGFQPQLQPQAPNSGPMPAMGAAMAPQAPMPQAPMPQAPMSQAPMPQGQPMYQPMPQQATPQQGYPQPGYGAPQPGYGQQQFGPQG